MDQRHSNESYYQKQHHHHHHYYCNYLRSYSFPIKAFVAISLVVGTATSAHGFSISPVQQQQQQQQQQGFRKSTRRRISMWSKTTTQKEETSSSTTTSNSSYDLVIIGGGSAGLTAAKFASQTLQKSVVIIEKDKLGGDCTWTGCVPSKSMIASAKASFYVRKQIIQRQQQQQKQQQSNTQQSEEDNNNFNKVKEKYKQHQQQIYDEDDSPEVLKKLNIDIISGNAKLLSSNEVEITINNNDNNNNIKNNIIANQGILLCTGASAKRPTNIPGLDSIDYLTYEEVWDIKELPKRLTIIGGGPIGCELAQAFSRLGSKVTIVASRLVPKEEPEVSELLEEVFINEGIIVVKGKVKEVSPDDDDNNNSSGGHRVTTTNNNNVIGDTLLLSVGRSPNVNNMGLETIGVNATSTNGIDVNENLETSIKGIYAAGDCIGDRQFTHYAGFQGAIAARNILLPLTDLGILTKESVPAVTFTSPEIASIGYTEEEAKDIYGKSNIFVVSQSINEIDRAICDDELNGIIKFILYNQKVFFGLLGSKDKIVGATIMAPYAGEMISEIVLAMKTNMSFDELAKVIHPYPTYSIAIQIMAADWYYTKLKKSIWIYDILKKLGL